MFSYKWYRVHINFVFASCLDQALSDNINDTHPVTLISLLRPL